MPWIWCCGLKKLVKYLNRRFSVDKYRCTVCNYIYDPETGDPDNGIEPGIPFEKLPEDWVCPLCGAAKSEFTPS